MISRISPRQLALSLGHVESFARDDFLAGPSNADALALIDRWPDWPGRSLALIGPEGSGKSHLASIWAEQAGARFIAARVLDVAGLPNALATGALVVEDLVAGQFDERALFHLFNLAREEDGYLLLTSRQAPAVFSVGIPDLRSRLRALPSVTLASPDDDLFRAVLVKLLSDRQIRVDESLVSYLSTRLERSFAAARAAVSQLDHAALRLKRPLNRALATELFKPREP